MHPIKQVYLFEPYLGRITGHWENNTRRFKKEFENRNIRFDVFCQTDSKPELISGLDAMPIFTPECFQDTGTPENFEKLVDEYKANFSSIDKTRFKKGDLLLFTTVMPEIHKAAIEWLNDIVSSNGPHVAFIYMIGAGQVAPNYTRKRLLLSCLNIPLLKNFAMKKLFTWTESSPQNQYLSFSNYHKNKNNENGYYYFSICDEYAMNFSRLLGHPVITLPFQTVPSQPTRATKNQDNTLTIGYFGHASLEKGAQFLENIVKRTLEKHPHIKFILHVNPNIHSKEILESLKKPIKNVTCHYGHLDQNSLNNLLHQVDINFLPYAQFKYADLPSMVFSDAMNASSVVVIPEYTWLSRTAKEINAGYTSYKEYDEENIYQALDRAIIKYKTLKEKTNEARENFLMKNNIENYVNILLGENKY